MRPDRRLVVTGLVACVVVTGAVMVVLDDPLSRVGLSPALLVPVAGAALLGGRRYGWGVLVAATIAFEVVALAPGRSIDATRPYSAPLALLVVLGAGAASVELGARSRIQQLRLREALQEAARTEGARREAAVAAARAENARLLLRMLSHELKTPLTTIQLGASSLVESLAEPTAAPPAGSPGEAARAGEREIAMLLERESRRLDDLITNVVSLHRMDHDLLSITADLDLADLTRSVVAEVASSGHHRPGSDRSPVDLTVDTSQMHGPTLVHGDADLLRIALRNLLDNALRHAAGATAVSVTLSDHPTRLVVRDDGGGLGRPPEALLQPFTTGPSSGGMGLGLSLVAAVATAHGATFDLADDPAGGVCATLTFDDHDESGG